MKNKVFLFALVVAMLVCMLAISVGAVSTTGNIDYNEKATLDDGTVLPIYDENKNPLIWYIKGTTEDGKNEYASVVSTATKSEPDANGYYVSYNGNTKTYTGPTGEKLTYHYSTSIYIKHVTDTTVNFKGDDTMVVANIRGVDLGDFQGGTIDKLQCLYAPVNMVRSGDFRNSTKLSVADFTQSTNMREIINQSFKSLNVDLRLPTLEPIYNEEGVLVNAFTISSYAFQGTPITSMTLPKTLYQIGNNAFQNAKVLTTIGDVPNLTIIGNDAFENCYVLTGLDFSKTSLVSIGERAFRYAGLQDHIKFPNTLKSIGTNAFRALKLTTAITLPESLETLGTEAFRSSNTLEYINFNNCKVEGSLGNYMFYDDKALKVIVFSDKITDLGADMVSSCSKLEVVYLPTNLENIGTFKNKNSLYFVSEKFSIDWYNGILESEDWDGNKPAKPSVYYMPSNLGNFGELFNSCHALNDIIVFPKGVTTITDKITFYNLDGKTFAFLGEVTSFYQESNKYANYYFLNDKVTADTLTITGNSKGNFYFHSAGSHLCEKTTTENATCVDNSKVTSICFCGENMGKQDVENTALGHEYDLEKGATKLSIVYTNYLANGTLSTRCARCTECDETETAPIIKDFKGFSVNNDGDAITFGYVINYDALDEFVKITGKSVELGFVVAVKAFAGDDAYTSDTSIKASIVNWSNKSEENDNKSRYIASDFILRGDWDKMVDLDGDKVAETDVKDVEFYMAGYLVTNNTVAYLNYGSSGTTADTVTFNGCNIPDVEEE